MIDILLALLRVDAKLGGDKYVNGFLLATLLYREHPELLPLVYQSMKQDDTKDSETEIVAVINAALEEANRIGR